MLLKFHNTQILSNSISAPFALNLVVFSTLVVTEIHLCFRYCPRHCNPSSGWRCCSGEVWQATGLQQGGSYWGWFTLQIIGCPFYGNKACQIQNIDGATIDTHSGVITLSSGLKTGTREWPLKELGQTAPPTKVHRWWPRTTVNIK